MFSLALPKNGSYPAVSIDISITGIDISIVDETKPSDDWRVLRWSLAEMAVLDDIDTWIDGRYIWGMCGNVIVAQHAALISRLDEIHQNDEQQFTVVELGGQCFRSGKHESVEFVIDSNTTYDFWKALKMLVGHQLDKLDPKG